MKRDPYQALYTVLSNRLINAGIITKKESTAIARWRHRKQAYWRRHIIDLCDYSIEKMQRNSTCEPRLIRICETGAKIAKSETTLH